MNRGSIRARVEEYLQDRENRRWSDHEVNRYIDDAQREFVRIVRFPQINAEVDIATSSAIDTVLSSSGKTATLTYASDHDLLTGGAVHISGATPDEYNGTFIIRKTGDTTATYQVATGATLSSSIVTTTTVGPTFSKPAAIQEIISASIDGVELMLLSEGQLNSAVFDSSSTGLYLDGIFGTIPNPFSIIKTRIVGDAYTPVWSDRNGAIEALIFNNLTAPTFRIFPLPKEESNLYIDSTASSKVFKKISIRGVAKITDIASDTSEPTIDEYWHEALVWGSLQRAYLKESQSRDVEKSGYYQNKFEALASQARATEGVSSASHSEGRNTSFFRIVR